jgi:hypothetical protein
MEMEWTTIVPTCCIFVLFQKLCCIVDKQFVVFVVNNLMYLLYYLLVL